MSAVKEPLMHVVKRDDISMSRRILVKIAATVLALIVCAIVIFALTGMNPLNVYSSVYDGAMGTNRRMWITFRDTAVLLCIGFAVMPAFRMRFWNTGAEGQVLISAVAAAAVMIYGKNLPSWMMYTLCPVAAMAAGAVWGIIPALFKAKWNTNETLFTLMMNYIATQIASFAIIYWENPKGSATVGLINSDGKIGWLPTVGGITHLLPVLIVLGLMVLLFVFMNYSKQGYEITVVGISENTARYAGINVGKVIIRTMAICGALAGVAGYLLVCGISHTISTTLVNGRGFTAIIVAWLGKLNPFLMLLIAFLLVFMQKGAGQIATQFKLNESASDVLIGIVLFFILGCEFFIDYRLEFRKKHQEGVKA